MTDIHRKKNSLLRIAATVLLFIYLCFLFWRLFFYAYDNIHRSQFSEMKYNIVPFKSLVEMVTSLKKYGFIAWGYNLFGNIVVFIPLGFLLLYVIDNKFQKIMLISFCIILFAELMQLVSRLGIFDVDDIILNLLGCLVGYFINGSIGRKRFNGRVR